MKKQFYLKISLILCVQSSIFCTAMNQGIAAFRSPKGFIDIGDSILIEDVVDRSFGEHIKEVLPGLIDSVERKHFRKFKSTFPIYLCHTNDSFCKYAGSKFPGPRAKVTPKGLFISPRLESSKDWFQIVYHELSHVIMQQNMGTYRFFFTPTWFHEGLATDISNGGGSGDVSDSAAIAEILKGNHFHPYSNDNILIQKSFNKDNIPPWMEYRQSMLFVRYLHEGKEKEFRTLLEALFNKTSFQKAIQESYGTKLPEIWDKFIVTLRR